MFSKIFLSKNNLIYNISYLQSIAKKPLCVMVKADAYGHGEKEIISMLDGRVEYFGVSNMWEGLKAREVTNGNVLVFGRCEDYLECMKKGLSFALISLNDCKKILAIGRKNNLKPKFHMCFNSGMNRYGFKNHDDIMRALDLLDGANTPLQGFYTHFSSLTTDRNYTQKQKEGFYNAKSLIPKGWNTICHVGGGKTIYMDIDADMYRTGIEAYGYGENLLPILSVQSEIVDIQRVKKGEHVGYLCGFTAKEDMTVATIPLGYGDGLPRKLSNRLTVKINGESAPSCGNICMDAFMVDVSNISCRVGDRVTILDNAKKLAPLIESTEYEVLTNLSKFRGERVII